MMSNVHVQYIRSCWIYFCIFYYVNIYIYIDRFCRNMFFYYSPPIMCKMPEEGIILKHLSLSRYIKRCCMSDNDAPYLSAHVYSDLGWLHPKGESIFSAVLILSYTLWVYIRCPCESDERGRCQSSGFSEAFVQILG